MENGCGDEKRSGGAEGVDAAAAGRAHPCGHRHRSSSWSGVAVRVDAAAARGAHARGHWHPSSSCQGLPFGSSDEPFPARTCVFACMSPPWLRVRRSGRSSTPGRHGLPSSCAWRLLSGPAVGVDRTALAGGELRLHLHPGLLSMDGCSAGDAPSGGGGAAGRLTPHGRSAGPRRACGRPRAPGCRRGSTGAPWVPACARAPSPSPTGGPAAGGR